ncbi:MAG TPA: hypothetical protein VIA02_07955 [Candidatus Limnocylindria bacterium]
MAYPNTAPITGAEKGWGLVMAVISFPFGLIALIGLLANQAWARWLGLVLGVLVAGITIGTTIWLLVVYLPGAGQDYPWGPWLVVITAVMAVLAVLAARTFLAGLRSPETEA